MNKVIEFIEAIDRAEEELTIRRIQCGWVAVDTNGCTVLWLVNSDKIVYLKR